MTPTVEEIIARADGDARQAPTSHKLANTYGSMMAIVSHPAFRIGFLDAQQHREFDHDRIMARIIDETPPMALARIAWPWSVTEEDDDLLVAFASTDFVDRSRVNRSRAVELAQYRYEEGRKAVTEYGLRCKAWGHPDFPPKAVMDYVWARIEKAKAA